MRYYHPVLKLFSFVFLISCIIAKNPISKSDKNDRPPFNMFSDEMLEDWFQFLAQMWNPRLDVFRECGAEFALVA